MPRYFFDLYKGDAFTLDEEGQNLDTQDKIRSESRKVLTDVFRDEIPYDENGETYGVKVRDHAGRYIFEARCTMSSLWLQEDTRD